MVSFSCENCGDVLTKKKLDPHRNRCRGATFTCIDCMVHFPGTEYRSHTSCMTEDQKYQGALYKGKKQKQQTYQAEVVEAPEPIPEDPKMYHHAYVEDFPEEYEAYRDYQVHDSDIDAEFPPEAPTPPSALPLDDKFNVFDFMQEATPNASNMDLHVPGAFPATGGRQLVRFNNDVDTFVDPTGYMVDDEDNVRYGSGAMTHYETPIPKAARRKSKESEVKKDKKRKRLHIETSPPAMAVSDEVMTDAPPVLHSGLTGGLNKLMRPPQFPPSPDYSGADGDHSPADASPIKKNKDAKPTKTGRTDSFGSGLKALLGAGSKPKTSKKRKTKHVGDKKERKERKERKEKKERKEHRKHRRHSSGEAEKKPKLIEYRPQSADGPPKEGGEAGTMVLYKPRSDLFLSLCTKGPDSERGCSVNKALKRFHRERDSSADSLGKYIEEKELWRSLRMRKNDRGEIVLFSIADAEN